MAFPTVLGRQSSSRGSDALNHDVVLPVAPSAGDLIVIVYATDGSSNANFSTTATRTDGTGAWSFVKPMADELHSTGCNGGVRYRIAAGDEPTTLRFTTSASEHFTARAYVIQVDTFDVTTPLAVTSVEASTANPNPPSNTPSWGLKDTLWIAAYAADGRLVCSAGPAGFVNFVNVISLTSGTASCSMSTADLEDATATKDPAAFTHAAEDHIAMTIAVQPGSAVPTRAVPARRVKTRRTHSWPRAVFR